MKPRSAVFMALSIAAAALLGAAPAQAGSYPRIDRIVFRVKGTHR